MVLYFVFVSEYILKYIDKGNKKIKYVIWDLTRV